MRAQDAALPPEAPTPAHVSTALLTVTALGVVYGDIGTSPLYALREAFSPHYGLEVSSPHVLGVLSLVFWSLAGVVTLKYLTFVVRADNRGEGGIFALLALLPRPAAGRRRPGPIVLAALFGAALLYGDGAITPAISVLSAVEGLSVATRAADPFVLPLTVAILVALFLAQRRGTSGIGRVFGPVMLAWFTAIGLLGAVQVAHHPGVLAACDPRFAAALFAEAPARAFALLGAVVLVVTGAEALYADLGHFGVRPIRLGWLALVWPALLLNYFGQGALLLADHAAAANPFYALVPRALLYPMVALATAATVIASQALISGAFSLTHQAVQLGYWPRVTVIHTSESTEGQIYLPEVNYGLMLACVGLVLGFRESSALAAAYGLAVTGTMTITSLVYYVVATRAWGWSAWRAAPLTAAFLAFDLPFFGASLLKLPEGAWFPLVLGAVVFVVMTSWKDGRAALAERMAASALPVEAFAREFERHAPLRVPGAAVFMSSNPDAVPVALLHHLKHNRVLHDKVVLLSVIPGDVPRVPPSERVEVVQMGCGLWRVVARYGFMETPSVPEALRRCRPFGLETELSVTSFYLSRETLLARGRPGLARWRKALFAFLARNAKPATAYYRLPPGRVVELGMQVDL